MNLVRKRFSLREIMNVVRKGFSLIEIMIVVLIIGVLMAGAFGGMRYLQRVRVQTTRSKLASVDQMLEQFNVTVGEYPTELQELVDGPSKPQMQRRWGEALAEEDELRDSWGHEFVYTVQPKGSRPAYELFSIGSKGDSQIFSTRSQEVN